MIQELINTKKIDTNQAKISYIDTKDHNWNDNRSNSSKIYNPLSDPYCTNRTNEGSLPSISLDFATSTFNLVEKKIKIKHSFNDFQLNFNLRQSDICEKVVKNEFNMSVDKEILNLMKTLGETYELPELKYSFIENLFRKIGYKKFRTINNENDFKNYIAFCKNFLDHKIRANSNFIIIPNKYINYIDSTTITSSKQDINSFITYKGKYIYNLDLYTANIDKIIIGVNNNNNYNSGISFIYNEPNITNIGDETEFTINYKVLNIGKSNYLTIPIIKGKYNILTFIKEKINIFVSRFYRQ